MPSYVVTIEFAVVAATAAQASEAVEHALEASQSHLDRYDIVDHTQFGSAKQPGEVTG